MTGHYLGSHGLEQALSLAPAGEVAPVEEVTGVARPSPLPDRPAATGSTSEIQYTILPSNPRAYIPDMAGSVHHHPISPIRLSKVQL